MEALAAGHPGTDNPQLGLPVDASAVTQGLHAQHWGDISSSAPQPAHLDASQLALLQQPQQPQLMQFTPDQLAALTGALNGNTDLSALTGALGANPELLQRLMVAPAEVQHTEQPTMNIELPRAPDLISNSFMLDSGAAAASDAQNPAAVSAAPHNLQQTGLVLPEGMSFSASMPQLQQQQTGIMLATDGTAMTLQGANEDAVAAAVAAAAAAGGTAGLSEELQLQLQRGVKRKAGKEATLKGASSKARLAVSYACGVPLYTLRQFL